MSPFTLFTISRGVFAGASTPYHVADSINGLFYLALLEQAGSIAPKA